MRRVWLHSIPALLLTLLVIVPFAIAVVRLLSASEVGLIEAFARLDSRYQTKDALAFSLQLAAVSTIVTVLAGLPLAWWLGRYSWPQHRLIRALLTTPFVVPSMVATIGFISLLGPQSWLAQTAGIDVWYSLTAIVIAHTWYNVALVVRLVEPAIARLDPSLEEAARLLPSGDTAYKRAVRLWWPVIRPNLAAAATLTFVFSFTSFALVRHLGGPGLYTIERAIAERPFAGISGVGAGAVDSEIVLALGLLQLLVLVFALWLLTEFQRRGRMWLPLATEKLTRKRLPRSVHRPLIMGFALAGAMAPLWFIIAGSFSVQGEASLEAWRIAISGERSEWSLIPALTNTVRFAVLTMLIAVPLAWLSAWSVSTLETQGRWPRLYARLLDVLVMLPLALSAVMVGYGVLFGLSHLSTTLMMVWWLPLLAHLVIALPFAMRVLLPAMRSLDKSYLEVARTLGASPVKTLFRVHVPLLRGPLIVAGILAFAISLGEFGATWLLWNTPDWTTLPVLVDRAFWRPYQPLARPVGHVAATMLLLVTVALFIIAERFRVAGQEGEF
jgi:thiamine transport system permease protein